MIFTDLTDNDRRDIIDYVSGHTGFLRNVVEKNTDENLLVLKVLITTR